MGAASSSGAYTESPNMDETPDLRLVSSKDGDSTNESKKADEALRPILAPPPGGGGMALSLLLLLASSWDVPCLEGLGKKDANQSDI